MSKTFYNTDLAVALKYDGKSAPKVTAKAQGISAEKIVAIAKQHDIPLHTEPELSQILAQVPFGNEIPEELYIAVAEVLAFAFYLDGKTPENL